MATGTQRAKVIVEYYGPGDYLLMLPNGDVQAAGTHAQAESKAKAYFRKKAGKNGIVIGVIEWRNREPKLPS
jgi:hypothetical protein